MVEVITTLGLSDTSGRAFVGRCLELKYRLPLLWQRVLDLEVAVWRAFKIADHTHSLPLDGAALVDRKVAAFAHSMTWSQLERTVEAARAEFDPEEVERRRTADPRHFDVHTHEAGIDGYVRVEGLLDASDALDLDAAVTANAAQFADLGCEEPLDVRRSLAMGRDGPRPARPRPRRQDRPRRHRLRAPRRDRDRDRGQHRHPRPARPGRLLVRNRHPGHHQAGQGSRRPSPHRWVRPHRAASRSRCS